MELIQYFIQSVPHTLLYLITTFMLTAGFLAAYTLATPQNEFALIREGKLAPAVSLVGALLGFVIPLGAVVSHSVSVLDVVLWGVLVLMVQIVVFFLAHLAGDRLCGAVGGRISDGCMAAATFTGGISLAAGILMAGCLVP